MAERPMRAVRYGRFDVSLQPAANGALHVFNHTPLPQMPQRLTERLIHWAGVAPERLLVAERDGGSWSGVSYAQAWQRVQAIAAALLRRDLSADRPVVILSGNAVDHLMLALGAMHVGIPHCAISPPYSLVSQDFSKLRDAVALLTPGLVYAADGAEFAAAIRAAVPADVEVVVSRNPSNGRPATWLGDLLATAPGPEVSAAHARTGADTIAKFMLTSGSTAVPKAVITTQRMLCANQVQIRETMAFLQDAPPVLLDWLPWNHTFGGSHNVGLVLYNGGTLYIDDGKPTPGIGIAATVGNLREIAPTVYFNVPKGFEMLLPYLQREPALRRQFFSRLQVTFFAGAGLLQHVWEALDDLAVATLGHRLPMLTGLGATETAPYALAVTPQTSRSGHVGLPVAGVELKLVPVDGKLEARVRGPNIMPGYWRRPDLTAAAFDEDGFYKFGDALRFVDPADLSQGFVFDGRITEDFKLATGTWVSVGPLRAALVAACAPLVRDAVLAGINQDDATALLVPDLDACRALCRDLPAAAPVDDVLNHAAVRRAVKAKLAAFTAQATGSAQRVMRAILLATPPSLDAGEITDKGSLNQRAVLRRRADLVAALYAWPRPRIVLDISDTRDC